MRSSNLDNDARKPPHKECTQFVLQTILGNKKLKVIDALAQKAVKSLEGRSVRLDVFARDGRGLPLYHIDRVVKECNIAFDDGAHIIYVNGKYKGNDPMGDLMHDFHCKKAGDKCINFKPKGASDDGCFARTSVISEYLRKKGFKVNYAITNHPVGLDDYLYHIAASVEIADEHYVVDPMLNCEGERSGLSKFSEWRDFQKPMNDCQKYGIPDTGLYTGYDANGNAIENTFIQGFYNRYNQNPSLTVPEYAEGWLENFVKTGERNYDGF